MQKTYQDLSWLLQRQWSSCEELYGAVRRVIGDDLRFDCFEEWRAGEVIIRVSPCGQEQQSFNCTVPLYSRAEAA